MAGLACAGTLVDAGVAVTVIDKGRVPGGRVSTRRADGLSFDHGAQYVTAREPEFVRWLTACQSKDVAQAWRGTIARLGSGDDGIDDKQRWVGVPGMNALARHLAAGLRVMSDVRIATVQRIDGGWRLISGDGEPIVAADAVVIAVPAPQAVPLLGEVPAMAARVGGAAYDPCWSVMLAFHCPLDVPYDGAFVASGPLSWICRDGSKPGRHGPETWVLHAAASWSTRHLEDTAEHATASLSGAFAEVTGINPPSATVSMAHRWRYARVTSALGEPFLFDPELGIGACGDWCLGGKVEAAYVSGKRLGDRLLDHVMQGMTHGGAHNPQPGKER